MNAFRAIHSMFPVGSDWTIYSRIEGVQPWRVVILSADRKREGIGTDDRSLEAAWEKAMKEWRASA